ETLVEFFDLLAQRDPARARALLKLWLEEAGTPQTQRMRAQFPDVGDCPVCGEATYEEGFVAGNSPTAPAYDARVCPCCGWTNADDIAWDRYGIPS
ncbi:MAG: hypothetical protein J7M26_03095, partial [Armatimonadetes bacterium]|nr:hypothetical protein [Armatimonadota bacterium]